ncbi:MAG: hypothetical protein RIF32_10270 [Leptospirales bacterium]|jgi:hypothetical protein
MKPTHFRILIIFLFTSLFSCGDEDPTATVDPIEAQWSEPEFRAAYVREHRREKYTIVNTSPSLRLAIQNLIDELVLDSGNPNQWVMSEREHREVIWPNLPDSDLANPTSSPVSHYTIVKTFQSLLWPALGRYRGRKLKVESIEFRKEPEKHYALTVHYPGLVRIKDLATGKILETKFVTQVVEHDGRFKISRVAP